MSFRDGIQEQDCIRPLTQLFFIRYFGISLEWNWKAGDISEGNTMKQFARNMQEAIQVMIERTY